MKRIDKMGVYRITNTVNSKFYIGSSVNVKSRIQGHLWHLRRGTHLNKYLQNSFNLYGESAFRCDIVESVDDVTILLEREQYWIDTTKPDYNICPTAGSRLGSKASDETRAKLSAALRNPSAETRAKIGAASKGNTYAKGFKPTEETRAKLRAARKGRKPNLGKKTSDETRAKMSAAMMGKKHTLGYRFTPEQRARVSASLMGHKITPKNRASLDAVNCKPIQQLDRRTSVVIKVWPSISQAARELGLSTSHISGVALGRYGRKTVGGFKWKYL